MKTLVAPGGQQFAFTGMDWAFYDYMLERVGDRHVFVTYDRGELEVMSPSRRHELYARMIGTFVVEVCVALGIPLGAGGMMTFRRKDLDRGLEPDDCYWIENEARVRGKMEIDLDEDPPPDLAIEVEISRRVLDREKIYGSLGVPELWCHDGTRLRFLGRTKAGYKPLARSRALPMLRPALLDRFLRKLEKTDHASVVRAFRAWVRDNLVKPRRGRR